MGKFQQCHIGDGWLSHACACQLRFPVKGAVIHAAAWGTQSGWGLSSDSFRSGWSSGNVACYYDGTFSNELKQLGYQLSWFIHGLPGYHLKHPEMVRTAGQRNWRFAKQFCWGCCPTKPHLASVACSQFCPLGQAKGSDLPSFVA